MRLAEFMERRGGHWYLLPGPAAAEARAAYWQATGSIDYPAHVVEAHRGVGCACLRPE